MQRSNHSKNNSATAEASANFYETSAACLIVFLVSFEGEIESIEQRNALRSE